MAFVTVKALTTAFTPVPHFFVFDRDSSFLSNTLSKFYLTEEPLHLASLLVVLSVYWKVLTDGHWLEIAVEFEFLLAPAHPIPYLKPNFFHLIPIQVQGCFQAGRSED